MDSDTIHAKIIDFDNADDLNICMATETDIDGIIKVASSVGNSKKNHKQGFLMDNYLRDKEKYVSKFKNDIDNSKLFYVIKKRDHVLGFLLAYTKDQWLKSEPKWIFDTNWKDDFNKKALKKFVILEKIAVRSGLTGRGLGSELFKKFKEKSLNLGIKNMFSETILSPKPNFASMEFAMKQRYKLAGIRYENFEDKLFTTIVYHKKLSK
ncbi:GNAT family N-acetyltransferase [Schnuerera sp. xch1]|uniref:GNAT family N-acetyltransferase n=1 Tax=Schnuerera sp. xch1 TaxID=2874283 RepID=UPI001CBAB3C3|nr:GNAT family N-acetyltransferase [Schnuerera sp. xch1]MBZ2175006.1 GNAT family N-acetyltransferase [Schnuerera sp. xch1]